MFVEKIKKVRICARVGDKNLAQSSDSKLGESLNTDGRRPSTPHVHMSLFWSLFFFATIPNQKTNIVCFLPPQLLHVNSPFLLSKQGSCLENAPVWAACLLHIQSFRTKSAHKIIKILSTPSFCYLNFMSWIN